MTEKEFLSLIERREAVVGIVGMGYVGLPLLLTFCRAGFQGVAMDVDAEKVQSLNNGKSYIKHIPNQDIAVYRREGKFTATADGADLRRCNAVIICVPTPLTATRDPDMSYVEQTSRMVAANLQPGHLVSLESTTYPGTTRDLVKPILEAGGLTAEEDFYLAFSPEREDPGRKDFTTGTIPKLVGGIGPKSRRIAVALYGAAIKQIVPVSSCEIAEAAKIVENVYRCVNIAMVNELKMLMDRMGIDIWEVIDAASTKPFGYQPFYPGPGLGGHCIPIDPFYLSWKARAYESPTRFIELAGEINTLMPDYVVSRLSEALNKHKKPINGSKILVLGIAYKKDVDDIRESPSIVLIEKLKGLGAKVDYNDPFVAKTHKQREHNLKMASKKLSPEMLAGYDCILIATDHSSYDYDMIVENAQLVVDTRNAARDVRSGRQKIVKA